MSNQVICLQGGKSYLWQWDTEQHVSVGIDASELHLKVAGRRVLAIPIVDELASIPDELLQQSGELTCYAYDGGQTLHMSKFDVRARPQPPGYVSTPEEALTWKGLDERITALEESGGGGGGIKLGNGLKRDESGAIAVDTANNAEEDNTLPITSAAVYAELGNIDVLLGAI